MSNHGGPTASWYDYQGRRIPDTVTHLRIGYMEYQQLKNGNAPAPIELSYHAVYNHPNLKQVQIYLPAVSIIGDHAFSHCVRLEHVEFVTATPREEEEKQDDDGPPSQLVSIGNFAFDDCRNLKSVIGLEHAAESLQEIGDEAFAHCKSLDNVNVNLGRLQSLGEFSFANNAALTTADLSRATCLTELQDETFWKCTALMSIHLSPNLLRIGSWAFWGCSSLEEIRLPPNLRSVGETAFERRSELKYICLPPSMQQLGEDSFWGCKKLSRVVLPSSRLPFLKTRPFHACKSLSTLELPHPVPRKEWPLVLEQFCQEDGIAKVNGGIGNPKNRNSIVWNFLCQNMAQLFIEDNAATMSRRRPASEL